MLFAIKPGKYGPIELMENGDYSICEILFTQETVVKDCYFDKVKVDKEKGEGKEIIFLSSDGSKKVVKYENGYWYRDLSEDEIKRRKSIEETGLVN